MATALKLADDSVETGTDIVSIVTMTPVIALTDTGKRDELYAHIRREIEAFEPDTSTEKGRAAIKSLAFKVTKTKTAIDAAGKQLNEEARAKINLVDEARRDARNTLDMLAEQARKPLTDWEAAEEARLAECRAIIEGMKAAAVVTLDDTADAVRQRGADVWNTALDAARFGDMLPEAEGAKDDAVGILRAALARLTREEADRAELERLRAENEARETKEREEAEARAQAEREAEEARQAEERRAAAERAEQERIATAAREAEERARIAAEQAAEAERQRVQREHEAALAAERQRAEDAERAAQVERDRVAAAEAARVAEEAHAIAEQNKRDADQAHKSKIMKAAKEAIMTCGVDEEAAKKVVLLIRAGEVPNVSLRF